MPTLIRKISFEGANAKIRALGNVLKRPLRDVLDSGARVAAISLAKSTVPAVPGSHDPSFGTGREAQLRGQKAVSKDINKVYAVAPQAYKDISDERAAKAFWFYFVTGRYPEAEEILQKYGSNLRDVPLGHFDFGDAHRAARAKSTGRVTIGRPKMIVIEGSEKGSALDFYYKYRQENVGFGKSGWADVVRAIDAHSSNVRLKVKKEDISAAWITGKGHGYGRAFHGGTDENPTITIESSIPYAARILSPSGRTDALRIARERMIENLRIAVNYEAKLLRSAA